MIKEVENWYDSWFDTDYYHILYQDRDHKEAQFFMDKLTAYLGLGAGDQILDLACGKGRHSIYLNSLGFDVTGADLSKNSIEFARKYENDNLRFVVHDMCLPFDKKFDAVFNLFTSFGYFENEADNLEALKAIKQNINPTGLGVIDFMNVDYVIPNLVPNENKLVNDINFEIRRYLKNNHIIKEISFMDKDEKRNYTEKVRALSLDDFKTYFKQANIDLLDIFGDYNLNSFHSQTSERLIMIFK
ncbi:class I SAM-dependent methyltransferase [Spongiivirga sp. MCCC 1A20706]|uniref:class I SAM-dependent methyltransferase n=1 Tax=Spongiivirga sp. MCCC 1A20706 TaxID=3160963 RepID=UPI003977546F